MALLYEKKDKIAYVTLNRPDAMNALDSETLNDLQRVWTDFKEDHEVLVAVITGAGDKAFCAGIDIQEISKGLGDEPKEVFWEPSKARTKLLFEQDIRKPIIAAINGFCIGAALQLVLECDIRIASENASFSVPEVKIGLAARGLPLLLARTMPLSMVMEMILTGDSISAQDAYRCGLVSRLVSPDELIPTAEKIAKSICSNAPLAVRANKETILKGVELPFEHASRLAISLAYAVQNSEDYQEGLRAIREKRKPEYKGK